MKPEYYYYSVIGTIAVGTAFWKIADFFLGMDHKITTILTNHLPHIEMRISKLEGHFEAREDPVSND